MNIGGFGETEKLIICYTLYRLDPPMENPLLPLFPLQIMLFPGEIAPLYIFEPRYRQLIEDCEKEKITFGITYINNVQLFHIGTEAKLHRVLKKYENGTSDIMVEALNFFHLKEFKKVMPGKLYSGGVIESIEVENKMATTGLKKNYKKFVQLIKNQILDDGELDSIKTLDIVKKINLPSVKKFQMLNLENDKARQKFLSDELKLMFKIREQENQIKGKFYLN